VASNIRKKTKEGRKLKRGLHETEVKGLETREGVPGTGGRLGSILCNKFTREGLSSRRVRRRKHPYWRKRKKKGRPKKKKKAFGVGRHREEGKEEKLTMDQLLTVERKIKRVHLSWRSPSVKKRGNEKTGKMR